jgi:hypothetical protein
MRETSTSDHIPLNKGIIYHTLNDTGSRGVFLRIIWMSERDEAKYNISRRAVVLLLVPKRGE